MSDAAHGEHAMKAGSVQSQIERMRKSRWSRRSGATNTAVCAFNDSGNSRASSAPLRTLRKLEAHEHSALNFYTLRVDRAPHSYTYNFPLCTAIHHNCLILARETILCALLDAINPG